MDLYAILGLKRDAKLEDLKRQHRTLVLKHHPDKAVDKEKAHVAFVAIQTAYERLLPILERHAEVKSTPKERKSKPKTHPWPSDGQQGQPRSNFWDESPPSRPSSAKSETPKPPPSSPENPRHEQPKPKREDSQSDRPQPGLPESWTFIYSTYESAGQRRGFGARRNWSSTSSNEDSRPWTNRSNRFNLHRNFHEWLYHYTDADPAGQQRTPLPKYNPKAWSYGSLDFFAKVEAAYKHLHPKMKKIYLMLVNAHDICRKAHDSHHSLLPVAALSYQLQSLLDRLKLLFAKEEREMYELLRDLEAAVPSTVLNMENMEKYKLTYPNERQRNLFGALKQLYVAWQKAWPGQHPHSPPSSRVWKEEMAFAIKEAGSTIFILEGVSHARNGAYSHTHS